MVPRISEMIEASRPNEPPVLMSGPDSVAVRIDSSMSPPDTANPNTFPCVKFHAQWMPIVNHSEFVYLYAAPSRTTASMAIATELQILALGLIMWAKPKIKADMPNGALVQWRGLDRFLILIATDEKSSYDYLIIFGLCVHILCG